MSLEPTAYSYNYAVISEITQADMAIGAGILVVGALIYLGLPTLYKKLEERAQLQQKSLKRQAIGDLISMKEIQGELEKEMRDALIRSELREKATAAPLPDTWAEKVSEVAQK
jgi:hypothetical protein